VLVGRQDKFIVKLSRTRSRFEVRGLTVVERSERRVEWTLNSNSKLTLNSEP
jgi:hypothetical protein